MFRRPLVLGSALLSLFLLACSSSSSEGTPPAPPPAEQKPEAIKAGFHFFSERDGFAQEVKSIVYTDRFHVRIDGLPKQKPVTLAIRLYSPGAKGRGYTASAVFTADDAGTIDTGKMAPVTGSGSYQGVDPDGLVWSAKPAKVAEPAEGEGPRTAAFFSATIDDEVVGTGVLGRTTTAPGVVVTPVKENGLVAELYMPAGATDRIPVVAFGGSEGGIGGGQYYAWQIASWGHPVLAVAYFGAPGVPTELEEVPLEYFDKAFKVLDARPETRKGKAVVIGGSRGGELALQLGATFPNVVGVIAETPSSFRWAGLSVTQEKAAWTFEGKPLAYVPGSAKSQPGTTMTPDGDVAYVLTPIFKQDMADAPADKLEAARIAVEKSSASILMIGGSDDAMWPACDFIASAMKRLEESGHKAAHQDEGICHAGAGHAVSSVGIPTSESMWADLQGFMYSLGGTAEANGHAARETSTKVKAFLERVTK
jgi:pimeloyl-ACP methyl ester carboxylesterase